MRTMVPTPGTPGPVGEAPVRRRPRATPRPAPPPAPVSLDALSAQWRLAFDAAQDAPVGADHCGRSLRLEPGELAGRSALLARERTTTAQLIDELAREQQVHLVHRLSAPRATRRLLGLPADVTALVFALDGVLTPSAELHSAAWEETFEGFLARHAAHAGVPFPPYNPRTDYPGHLHGRPRLEGVRSFLASRGITLAEGAPDDPPGTETVNGLANGKNLALQRRLAHDGVAAFEGSRRYIEDAREAGLRVAVVSASANTNEILRRSGLAGLVDECLDGETMRELGLRPRPAPDTFVAACGLLGVEPAEAAAFVTSSSGIEAVRAAGVETAIAVDREGVHPE